jgi:hypothetical protein
MSQTHNMGDYDKTYAEFKWEVPEFFNFARDVLDKWAEDPNKLAIWWVDDDGNEVKKTFAELCKRSRQLCNVFLTLSFHIAQTRIKPENKKNKNAQIATTAIPLFYRTSSSAGVTFFGGLIRSARKILLLNSVPLALT